MSRAFVKDDDDRPEEQIDIPVSEGPNYVTAAGLEALRARLAAAEAAGNERDARYFAQRIDAAVVMEPRKQRQGVVEFGTSVTVRDESGRSATYTIVGEDEADPVSGRISHASPVAQALIGKRKGANVVVHRPAGPIRYRIESVSY